MERIKKHKARAGWLTALVVVFGLGLFLFGGSDSKDDASASVDTTTTTTTTTIELDEEEIAADLTVKPGDLLPDSALCLEDGFIPNSLAEVREGDPAFRQWSDAVSVPFWSSDEDGMRSELSVEHCGNPTELSMSIEGLSEVTVAGLNIGELNPWMGEFLEMADEGMRETFLTFKEDEDGNILEDEAGNQLVFVTEEYQQFAAMTNTLLLAFQVSGVESRQSVENWHLPVPTVGELPRAVLNDQQEGLPSLVLEYTLKDNCPLVRIGYNTGDKRFEVFKTPECPPPPEPTPTTKPTTTTTTPPPTPTTKPPPTTTTPPPTTEQECPSDKCVPPTTVAPPPTTEAPPASSTTTTVPPSGGDSGEGAPPPTSTSTTSTTAPPNDEVTTTKPPPTTRVEY